MRHGWGESRTPALVAAPASGARIETLYLDVPDTFDRDMLREWRATASIDGAATPVCGGGLVLVPPPA